MPKLLSLLGLSLFALLGLAASQQTLEKIPVVDFQRETELDPAGLKQFKAFDVKCEACRGLRDWTCQGCDKLDLPNCPECKGTKKAPCRVCAGRGKTHDPLLEHTCTYCRGSAWYDCAQCGGMGYFFENSAGGERLQKPCGACKKVGRYACNPCGGKRVVDTVRIKRKAPSDASAADLRATQAELQSWMAQLEAFEPLDRAAKSTKALEGLVARPGRTLAPLKDMLALLEEVQKGLTRAGAGYQNYEERQNFQFLLFRDRSIHLLRHNLRALELCIERADFNETVAKNK